MGKIGRTKRGQVTLFIILAIVIVGAIILFLTVAPSFASSVPEDMRPIYDYYLSCLENEAEAGVRTMGEQGGYLDLPDFVPGSAYNPSSSQLSFFGQGVPYWLYITGNNFLKEQVPTKVSMELQLADYVKDRLTGCDFSDFEKAGFDIYVESGEVTSRISDGEVEWSLNNKITIFGNENSVIVENHKISVKTKLGKFYEMALKIYDKEKSLMFLEDYAIDVMRLYAPVDGVDLSCAPKVFVDEVIRADLYEGLESNMNFIKFEGDYYELSNPDNKYFVRDMGFDVDENVQVMYNKAWPTRIEIYGDRIVKPIGAQPGLSALGFCYTPYHLVYDISFPVMIQFYDTEDFFQFPISVVIDKSQPRKSIPVAERTVDLADQVCRYMNSDIEVYTYDSELNPVTASLTFKCLDSSCSIGETVLDGYDAVFVGQAPQCVNGFVTADAPGYAQGKVQISTNSEGMANILLKKEYELDLDVSGIIGSAMVTFTSKDYSTTVVYPEMDTVKLIEGMYDISAFVYGKSALKFPGSKNTICVDVPVTGIGGILGLEEEKCYDVEVPSMEIDMAVIGGGKGTEYVTTSMLKDSVTLNVDVPIFSKPNSLEELQDNYAEVETSIVFLEFE